MGDSKTLTVATQNGDVVVRKLALGDYAALLRALKKLPAEVGKFLENNDAESLKDTEKLFSILPALLAEALPDFADIMAAASDKDGEFFINGDLADALDVFAAILELNDYSRIVATVKKLTARKPGNPGLVASTPKQ